MQNNDYYEVLGVESDAPAEQVRAAYRKLALKYHPDRNRDDAAAAARMKALNEAYAVLSDTPKRAEYDALRRTYGASAYGQFRQTYSEQDIFRGSDINQMFEQISRAFGFRGVDDVFQEFYGSGFRSFEFRRPGMFGRAFVYTPGAGRSGEARSPLRGGLGRLIRYGLKKKWGLELPERGADLDDRITISPSRARSGGKISYLYRKGGRELVVTVPPGIRSGQRIRLRGMGNPGQGGAEAGDLYIRVGIRQPLLQTIWDTIQRWISRLRS